MLQALILKFKKRFRARRTATLEPDEVLLDAHNLPQFDRHQFEGRLAAPIPAGTLSFIVFASIAVLAVLSGRLWYLQIAEGEAYALESQRNRLHHSTLFAERGLIYDRRGVELAWNVPQEDDEPFAGRAYLDAPGFAHVLGYVALPRRDASGAFHRINSSGVTGAEALFNERLTGENGLQIVETNALGEVESQSAVSRPSPGANVRLSIDAAAQQALHEFIAKRAQEAPFEGGAGVLMDVASGEVLALTSYPEFDPDVMSAGDNAEAITGYQADERTVFLNRAVAGLYTPGSIVKPFIALGALEEGIIDPREEILSTGALYVPNPYVPGAHSVFHDWRAHGFVDMRDALAISSNVYFFEIGGGFEDQEGLGIERIERYMRLFGLGEKSGIGLSSEQAGVIPNPQWKAAQFDGDAWRLGDTYNTAIGQYGFQVTPLAMARAAAALAEGALVRPTLVAGERGTWRDLPVAPEHLAIVREGMRAAVTRGTAAALNVPHVDVAGKTGTAEVGAENALIHSWVIGFFPYEQPRYAFAVVMERGPAGTMVGAPYVMRQFLDWLARERPAYLRPR